MNTSKSSRGMLVYNGFMLGLAVLIVAAGFLSAWHMIRLGQERDALQDNLTATSDAWNAEKQRIAALQENLTEISGNLERVISARVSCETRLTEMATRGLALAEVTSKLINVSEQCTA